MAYDPLTEDATGAAKKATSAIKIATSPARLEKLRTAVSLQSPSAGTPVFHNHSAVSTEQFSYESVKTL